MKRLLSLILLALVGLTSCHKAAAPSTAITCTTATGSSSSSSTSTCTDPVTGISLTISPASASVNVVTSLQFLFAVSGGTNNVVTWQVNKITGGNDMVGRIDANGKYIAPSNVPSPAAVTVGVVSFEDSNLSATSTVTIVAAPVVKITSPTQPITVTSGTANTLDFKATVTGGTLNTVSWEVGTVKGVGGPGDATLGTIDANGVYSAPATPPIGSTVFVTAVSQDSATSFDSVPVTISGYSTSSLQGQFEFSIAGHILSGPSAGPFFRAGSFFADGAGNLSGGMEDFNETSGVATLPSFVGTYTVSSDGRGTLSFNDSHAPANLSSNFDFVLVNGGEIQITGFDASTYPGTATGQANAQIKSSFSGDPLSALSGTYVFDFTGVLGSNALSQIGEFTADVNHNIKGGSIDVNDAGTATRFQIAGNQPLCNQTQPPANPSTYTVDSNGRGSLTLNLLDLSCNPGPTLTFNFYVVSQGSAKFVGTNTTQAVAGMTMQQAPNQTFDVTALSGHYAFLLSGSAPGGAIATAGSFAADAGCHIRGGELDENLNGTPFPGTPILDGGTTTCSYTVGSNGRGTVTFSTAGRTYNLVFYIGPVGGNGTTAVFQETDSSITSDGLFAAQSAASLQGNYAIDTSGLAGSPLQTQVISGQIGTDGTSTVTSGSIDINTGGRLAAGQAVSGSYSAPDMFGRTTLSLNSGTLSYAAYIVNSTQAYLVGIQTGQLAAGTLLRQF